MKDTNSKTDITIYPYKLCQKALACVFDSVQFYSPKTARIMRDSYFMNLKTMLKYADANNIDELEYILDIPDILIASKYAHELW